MTTADVLLPCLYRCCDVVFSSKLQALSMFDSYEFMLKAIMKFNFFPERCVFLYHTVLWCKEPPNSFISSESSEKNIFVDFSEFWNLRCAQNFWRRICSDLPSKQTVCGRETAQGTLSILPSILYSFLLGSLPGRIARSRTSFNDISFHQQTCTHADSPLLPLSLPLSPSTLSSIAPLSPLHLLSPLRSLALVAINVKPGEEGEGGGFPLPNHCLLPPHFIHFSPRRSYTQWAPRPSHYQLIHLTFPTLSSSNHEFSAHSFSYFYPETLD